MTQCKDEYTCAACHGTFHKDPEKWSEEQAEEEYFHQFGQLPGPEDVIICDTCFKKLQQIMADKKTVWYG